MRKLLALATLCVSSMAFGAGPVEVDKTLPDYVMSQGVSGNLKSMGSNTLNNVMTHWAELFKKYYPSVKIEIEGKGSGTAPPALIEGQAQFGPMSRAMKADEVDKFEKKFGYKPVGLRVAIDTLAVYVHKDCPLTSISMEQLQKVFSVTGPNMTWDELGVKDANFVGKPISLYGRDSASGTYDYFKEHALGKKDFKPTVKEQPGSSGVVSAVASDKFAIGYSGVGYTTADVKTLKLSSAGGAAIEPSAATAYSGDYPMARALFVYVNFDASKKKLDPLREEFVKLVFSKPGQEAVVKDGFIPVTAEMAREDLKKVGIEPNF